MFVHFLSSSTIFYISFFDLLFLNSFDHDWFFFFFCGLIHLETQKLYFFAFRAALENPPIKHAIGDFSVDGKELSMLTN